MIILSLLTLSILTFVSCDKKKKEEKSETKTVKNNKNFDWLLGNWKRVNEKEGRETFEIWNKKNDTTYYGIGFTMQKKDTVKQEKMEILKVNENWELVVKVPEETNKISFKIIQLGENEFTSENKENDFPNTIKYWKKDKKLHAAVSGGDLEIPFEFEKN